VKKIILIILPLMGLLSSCLFVFGGITGSGRLVTSSYYQEGFKAVNAQDAVQVNINYGNTYEISVISDDNFTSYIDIYSDGYTLHVGLIDGVSYFNGTFTVNITMPFIDSLKANGASDVQISGFTLTENLDLELNGASHVDVFLTDGPMLTVSANGASDVEVHSVYPVEKVKLTADGASGINLEKMVCYYGEISINGASSARVNMVQRVNENFGLTGQVSGASVLYYRGPFSPGPILFSGASSLVCY